MAIPATNINEVIAELDIIIAKCLAENSKMGLFAALYRKVTLRVKEGIAVGRFDDGERMERLDVLFANRYLEAYCAHCAGTSMTSSWQITFDASKNPSLFMIQHLFAGMNSHISLDLGIATAKTAEGKPLSEMERDFNEINHVLSDMIDEVQKALEKTSLMMMALDWLAGNQDERLARFSLEFFRKRAWDITNHLYGLTDDLLPQKIAELDNQVTKENHWFTAFGGNIFPPMVRMAAVIQNRKAAAVIQAFNSI
jgi:hypothetical protein